MIAPERETIYYDGGCGLCHRAVRFVLAQDRQERPFFFAPLQGSTFETRFGDETRRDLPDSVVVETSSGELLVRSRAALHVLVALGGWWRVLARIMAVVPRSLSDRVYDAVAAIRLRAFKRPADVCPIVPPAVQGRFLP